MLTPVERIDIYALVANIRLFRLNVTVATFSNNLALAAEVVHDKKKGLTCRVYTVYLSQRCYLKRLLRHPPKLNSENNTKRTSASLSSMRLVSCLPRKA